jgi:hypothetical protein
MGLDQDNRSEEQGTRRQAAGCRIQASGLRHQEQRTRIKGKTDGETRGRGETGKRQRKKSKARNRFAAIGPRYKLKIKGSGVSGVGGADRGKRSREPGKDRKTLEEMLRAASFRYRKD